MDLSPCSEVTLNMDTFYDDLENMSIASVSSSDMSDTQSTSCTCDDIDDLLMKESLFVNGPCGEWIQEVGINWVNYNDAGKEDEDGANYQFTEDQFIDHHRNGLLGQAAPTAAPTANTNSDAADSGGFGLDSYSDLESFSDSYITQTRNNKDSYLCVNDSMGDDNAAIERFLDTQRTKTSSSFVVHKAIFDALVVFTKQVSGEEHVTVAQLPTIFLTVLEMGDDLQIRNMKSKGKNPNFVDLAISAILRAMGKGHVTSQSSTFQRFKFIEARYHVFMEVGTVMCFQLLRFDAVETMCKKKNLSHDSKVTLLRDFAYPDTSNTSLPFSLKNLIETVINMDHKVNSMRLLQFLLMICCRGEGHDCKRATFVSLLQEDSNVQMSGNRIFKKLLDKKVLKYDDLKRFVQSIPKNEVIAKIKKIRAQGGCYCLCLPETVAEAQFSIAVFALILDSYIERVEKTYQLKADIKEQGSQAQAPGQEEEEQASISSESDDGETASPSVAYKGNCEKALNNVSDTDSSCDNLEKEKETGGLLIWNRCLTDTSGQPVVIAQEKLTEEQKQQNCTDLFNAMNQMSGGNSAFHNMVKNHFIEIVDNYMIAD